ncbi:MAG: DUF4097 domain-containing protein [Cytophagales bacterium]|nr:DUF4097 domain-containing protein [Cytophagales bacterium]
MKQLLIMFIAMLGALPMNGQKKKQIEKKDVVVLKENETVVVGDLSEKEKEQLRREIEKVKKDIEKTMKEIKNSPELLHMQEDLKDAAMKLQERTLELVNSTDFPEWQKDFVQSQETWHEALRKMQNSFDYSFNIKFRNDTSRTPVIFEKKLGNNIRRIQIQGLNGQLLIKTHNQNIIRLKTYDRIGLPKKANGLRLLSNQGTDNTGLGLELKESGDELVLEGIIRKSKSADFEIWLPQKLAVSFSNAVHADAVKFVGVDRDLVINAGGRVELEEVTGPITAKVTHGDLMASFLKVNQAKPISITCTHGDIDLSVPSNTKMDLDLKTAWGEAFSDLNLNIEQEAARTSGHSRSSSSKLKATLNGGGVKVVLRGVHGNVYLRKK